ncbi:hypothetical protein [Paracoccus cavernae]|uniref:hypothetical protein n=1 Tax=Paracoccus cavernae TaxID=1571207 RepID=UPI003633CA7E
MIEIPRVIRNRGIVILTENSDRNGRSFAADASRAATKARRECADKSQQLFAPLPQPAEQSAGIAASRQEYGGGLHS